MPRKKDQDPRVGLALTAYTAIMASVPTARQPKPTGPLTSDEVVAATEFMDELGEAIEADREKDDT